MNYVFVNAEPEGLMTTIKQMVEALDEAKWQLGEWILDSSELPPHTTHTGQIQVKWEWP